MSWWIFWGSVWTQRKGSPQHHRSSSWGPLEVAQYQGDPDSYGLLPKPERVQNLVSDVDAILEKDFVTSNELASLRGRVLHILGTMYGRLGEVLTTSMTEMISAGALEISWGLRRDLVWFKALLNCQPGRIVNLASKRRQLVVVSDASWDSFAWQRGGAQMSWWIFAEGRPAFGEVCFVPPKFLHRCQTRESYIALAELSGGVSPSHSSSFTCGGRFRDVTPGLDDCDLLTCEREQ